MDNGRHVSQNPYRLITFLTKKNKLEQQWLSTLYSNSNHNQPNSTLQRKKKKTVFFLLFIFWVLKKFPLCRTTAYQHYPYTSHSHYPQYAFSYTSPVTPQSTTTTATATTSQTQQQQPQSSSSSSSQQTRQYSTSTYNINASANASSGMDTADIATLNDALGSAGVDLRVSSFFSLAPTISLYLLKYPSHRLKKNLYNAHTTIINPTDHLKIARENNLQNLLSTHGF